jgi:thiamine-phosphate pyrophosphorylase
MEPIIISSSTGFKAESDVVNRLFEAGLQIFHLRKPTYSMLDCRQLLGAINPLYHNRIALHQHHELAAEFNINRVHYPEALRNKQQGQLPETAKVRSTSIHKLNQLDSLGTFDYAFFGPVFNSLSKPGYRGIVAPLFRLDKGAVTEKVIALGGIDSGNIVLVKEMKFDGIALLGCIWNHPREAVETFINIKSLWQGNDRLQ